MAPPSHLKTPVLRSLAATVVGGLVVAVLWAAPHWPALAGDVVEPGGNLGVLAVGLVVLVRLLTRWRLRP